MKKQILFITAVLGSLLIITASASAQVEDMVKEGEQLMEASQYLIDQGQIMEKCTCANRAAMIDQGNQMVKKGTDVLASGMMMTTSDGRFGTQLVGKKIEGAGKLLIKKGEQADPLTDKDKEEVNKLGKDMVSFGNLKLQIGKHMGGE